MAGRMWRRSLRDSCDPQQGATGATMDENVHMNTFCFKTNYKDVDSNECINFIVSRLREHKLNIFFGAGVSRDFPTLNPLVDDSDPIPGFRTLLQEILVQGCPSWAEDAIKESIKDKPLEWLLEHYIEIVGERALNILSLLQEIDGHPNSPNYNHYALASLATKGFCRFFLTVNFDIIFEQAFLKIKINSANYSRLIIPEASMKEKRIYNQVLTSTSPNNCYLFKLHGTLENQRSILTTVETLGFGLPPHKRKLIQNLLRGSTCLFIGYREGDLDIFPVLDILPSDAEVIWYEKNFKAKDSPSLGSFLARRPHFLIIGDLGPILQEILKRLGISDEPIWELLTLHSFSDIQSLQNQAEGNKAILLRNFVKKFGTSIVTNEAACLIAARILSLGYPDGRNLRKKLFNSIDPQKLSAGFQYVYCATLAELKWNVGELSKAVKFRKLALSHIKEAQLSRSGKTRAMMEQHLRIIRDSISHIKWSCSFKKLYLGGRSVKYFFLYTMYRLSYGMRLTPIERGSLIVMPWYFPGDFFEWIHEILLRKRLLIVGKEGKMTTLKRALINKILKPVCRLACFFYRQHERYREYSFGWNSHCMRRLGEMLLHRAQSDVPMSHKLFVEADRAISWVDDNPNKLQGELDQAVKPGLHIALRLLYAGAPEEALSLLRKQYEVYKQTEHLSGKRKTLLYSALCFEKMGKTEELRDTLKQLNELIGGYG